MGFVWERGVRLRGLITIIITNRSWLCLFYDYSMIIPCLLWSNANIVHARGRIVSLVPDHRDRKHYVIYHFIHYVIYHYMSIWIPFPFQRDICWGLSGSFNSHNLILCLCFSIFVFLSNLNPLNIRVFIYPLGDVIQSLDSKLQRS